MSFLSRGWYSLLNSGFMESKIWAFIPTFFALFLSKLTSSLLVTQLAIPESFCRATFSLVAYGYLTGGADTVQMKICLWVFLYFSFCEFGCCIDYSKLGYFFTPLHPAHFWCFWTSLKDGNTEKLQCTTSCFSFLLLLVPLCCLVVLFRDTLLGVAVPFSCLLPSYLGSFFNAFCHWSV